MKTELDGPLPLEMRWINQRRDEGICIVSCELLVSNGDSHELSKCRSGTGDAAKKNFGGRISSVGGISGYVSRPSTFADVRGSGNNSSRRPAPDLWLPATIRRRRRHSRESCHAVTARATSRATTRSLLVTCSCQRHCDHSNGGYTATKPVIS